MPKITYIPIKLYIFVKKSIAKGINSEDIEILLVFFTSLSYLSMKRQSLIILTTSGNS
jgi:hypothetical protein